RPAWHARSAPGRAPAGPPGRTAPPPPTRAGARRRRIGWWRETCGRGLEAPRVPSEACRRSGASARRRVTKLSPWRLDVRQRRFVAPGAPPRDGEEVLLEAARHGPGRTRADAAIVELADGRDLGRRPGKEGFVGQIYLVAGEALLADLQALVAEHSQR